MVDFFKRHVGLPRHSEVDNDVAPTTTWRDTDVALEGCDSDWIHIWIDALRSCVDVTIVCRLLYLFEFFVAVPIEPTQ